MILIMLTIFLLLFTIAIIYIVGSVVWKLFFNSNTSGDTELVPILGISVIILMAQNLVYLDIPLKYSAWITLLIFVCLGVVYIIKNKGFKIQFHLGYSKTLIFLLFCVTGIHALGYLIVGAEKYVGYGWIDQFNYTVISQFLVDYPFHTSMDQINQPSLVRAIMGKDDRIGQSIFQGFISVLTNNNSKTVYGAVSLISAHLMVFSIWITGKRMNLSKGNTIVLVLVSTCMPGLALIHLTDFFSHALVLPFLYIWPFLVNKLLVERNIKTTLFVSIIFSAANSIYTEFTPLFLGILLLGVIWQQLSKGFDLKGITYAFLTIPIAILSNIGYFHGTKVVLSRVDLPNILSHIYPYAYKVEGIMRLWLFTNPFKFDDKIGLVVTLTFLVLTIIGISGLVMQFFVTRTNISLSLLVMVFLPVIVLAQQEPHPYQFYKILSTICPLFIFGIIYLGDFIIRKNEDIRNRFLPTAYNSGIALILVSTLLSTLLLSYETSKKPNFLVHTQNEESVKLFEKLEKNTKKNYLIVSDHHYVSAWLTYHARNSNVWVMPTLIGDVDFRQLFPNITNFSFFNFDNIKSDEIEPIVLNTNQLVLNKLKTKVFTTVENKNGIEGPKGNEFSWLGEELIIKILSLEEGMKKINISINIAPGPSVTDPYRKVRIGNDIIGWKEYEFTTQTDLNYSTIVNRGFENIQVQTVLPREIGVVIPNDPRKLFARINAIKMEDYSE